MRTSLILALLIVASGLAIAQDSKPTLDVTLAFIKTNIQELKLFSNFVAIVRGSAGVEESFQVFGADIVWSGCQITLSRNTMLATSTYKNGDAAPKDISTTPGATKWVISIPLDKLSVAGIKVEEFDPHQTTRKQIDDAARVAEVPLLISEEGKRFALVILPALSGEKPIRRMAITQKGETSVSMQQKEYLPVTTVDLGNRLAKAFSHAAGLCGAKSDPF